MVAHVAERAAVRGHALACLVLTETAVPLETHVDLQEGL